jgi:TPR repeat protein
MNHDDASIDPSVSALDNAQDSEPPSIAFTKSSARLSERSPRGAVLTALVLGALGCLALLRGAASSPTAGASSELESFRQGCAEGDAVACNNLGVTYAHGYSVSQNAASAARAFERACQGGSADGCSNLGALYERGEGTAPNLAEALRLYEQSCTMGAALGCSNLGALRALGKGITRDATEALRLFALACETGSAAGCSNLMASNAH